MARHVGVVGTWALGAALGLGGCLTRVADGGGDDPADAAPALDAGADAQAPDAARDGGSADSTADAARDQGPPPDADPDAQPMDSSVDSSTDARPDSDAAPADATPDAPSPDAGPDAARPDATADAAPDAGPDGGCVPRAEICNSRDDDCDGAADEGLGVGEPCEGVGACGSGRWECADNGDLRCSRDPDGSDPGDGPETCNGEDDDCDGQTDEDPEALAVPCYEGPPETAGRGACSPGVAACLDGALGPCEGQVLPADDACDGEDDDCDGATDEAFVADAECGEGVCRLGARPSRCERGVEVPCQPGPPTGDDTDCDGHDDDCDGTVDDGYVSMGCGLGRCAENALPSSCTDGVEVACHPGAPAARDFTCDGVDDDCDGTNDEDYAPVLECGAGVCRRDATPSRCEDGVEVPCRPGPSTGDDTDCDGEDDDCDGVPDDGYEVVAACGVGACRDASRPSRCAGGVETACQPGAPAADDATCDGADDDCNGAVDDGYVAVARCGEGVCAAGSTPSSCDEGVETECRPGAPAGADDTCDDADQDCDGRSDEGVPVVAGAVQVTNGAGDQRRPSLASTGNGFGIAWSDTRGDRSQIFFARLDAAGRTVAGPIAVSVVGGNHFNPALAYTGDGFGLAWYTTREGTPRIYFARIDLDGRRLADEHSINTTFAANVATLPAVAWNGAGFGVAWQDDRDGVAEVWYARLDAAGNRVGEEVQVTDDGTPSGGPAIAWNGAGFGLTWSENRADDFDVLFARVGLDGRIVGRIESVTALPTNSSAPDLVWNGNGYGIAWQDTRDGNAEIYFARVNAGGQRLGDDVRVTNDGRPSNEPSLAWNGASYGVSWFDRRDGNDEIYFAHLAADGANTSGDLRVTEAAGASQLPSLVWGGAGYAVAWYDGRDGPQRVWFARGGFGCP